MEHIKKANQNLLQNGKGGSWGKMAALAVVISEQGDAAAVWKHIALISNKRSNIRPGLRTADGQYCVGDEEEAIEISMHMQAARKAE